MANPQPDDAHLRIAHSIEEQIICREFTEHELKILLFILRLSWGCGKHSAIIPRQKDFEIVGIREVHIKARIDYLISSRVIFREGTLYQFNKDFDNWNISRHRSYTPEKLTELVNLNIKSDDEKLTEYVSSAETPHKRERKKKENIDEEVFILPSWISQETWNNFMEVRKKKKAINTPSALNLIIKELENLKAQGNDPIQVLNKSIMNTWKGVFPLKNGGSNDNTSGKGRGREVPERDWRQTGFTDDDYRRDSTQRSG